MKRLDLIPKIRELGVDKLRLWKDLLNEIKNTEEIRKENLNKVKVALVIFISKVKRKLTQCGRNYDTFIQKENRWLQRNLMNNKNCHFGSGRPHKQWNVLGEQSKRKKIKELATEHHEALFLASAKSANAAGEKKKASFLKNNISNLLEIEKVDKTLDKTFPIIMSVEEALALKMNTDLSDKQYQMIRNSALVHNVHIYPTLHDILVEKLKCYPENIHFSEISAKCTLQSMLDHTVSRITEMIDMPNCGQGNEIFGVLYGKIGFDGASSQSVYKQKYFETSITSIELKSEENLFSTAFVPLLLKVKDGEIWKNANPSSCHFCRPLHLQYKKESPILSREEESDLKNQINTLKTFCKVFDIAGRKVTFNISYRVDLTMFDNKVVNALTETKSTQSCNVCNAKPNEMNNIDLLKAKTENESALGLGISALHCWIKCLEFILHLSYKIEIKKYKPKTIEEKLSVDLKKKQIQELFRERLSLYVDMPKTGSGNTNDGNTARRAFKNSKAFSEITKVDCDIIERLHNILITISCGYSININELDLYCTETAKRIVSLYNWYVMPPTVHKLLLHSSSISHKLPLPVGVYSEDALESLNKQIRNSRLKHTAKISRLNTMMNQMHYLLVRSDPKVSSISFRKHKSYRGKPLPDEVIKLIVM